MTFSSRLRQLLRTCGLSSELVGHHLDADDTTLSHHVDSILEKVQVSWVGLWSGLVHRYQLFALMSFSIETIPRRGN